MTFVKLSAFAAFLAFQVSIKVVAHSEVYLYNVYYDTDDCSGKAVSITGFSSGDEEITVGANDNATQQCSVEAMCLLDRESAVCQDIILPNVTSGLRNDINDEGKIFQCDETNGEVDQALCRYIEGCSASSVFPTCHFELSTTTDIFANLDLVRNDEAFDNPGLELHSYMVLYSDEDCTEFEGVQGIVAGETDFQGTSEDMACEEAVACAFFPEGEQCNANGGTTGVTHYVYTEPSVSTTTVCTDASGEHCEQIGALECRKSEIFPTCWYRHPTAIRLLAQPENYFVGTKYNHQETDAPTAAPTEEQPADSAPQMMARLFLTCALGIATLMF